MREKLTFTHHLSPLSDLYNRAEHETQNYLLFSSDFFAAQCMWKSAYPHARNHPYPDSYYPTYCYIHPITCTNKRSAANPNIDELVFS